MKQTFGLAAVSLALLLLSGCASNASSRYATEQKFVVDQHYVDAVNHANRQAGVRVTWVNPPTKRAALGSERDN